MTIEHVPQEKFPDRQPFNPPGSPPQVTDGLHPSLQNPLIEKCLKQLGEKELLGEPYVKDYLHDQKRRNCRPNTIRSNFTTLMLFLSYLKERGRTSLETITRDDMSSFIEHEQDRGMQPNTVSTRLRLLYAFLRYLVDQEVVHPDLLKRKLRVKVPEALPRAMDPEDVQQFLAVIEKPRDRALILVLLRTGMRIGELLATRMSEVNLREKRIIIREAQKTRVGRVAYLSEDACAGLNSVAGKERPGEGASVLRPGTAAFGLHCEPNEVRQDIWKRQAWRIRAIVCIVCGIPAPPSC